MTEHMLEILVPCASGKKAEDFVFTRDDGMHGGTFVLHPDSEGFNAANSNRAYSKAESAPCAIEKKGEILRTAPSRSASDWAQLLDRTTFQQIPLNDAELAVVEDGVEAMENCFNSSRISTHPTAQWPVSKTSPRPHRNRESVLN